MNNFLGALLVLGSLANSPAAAQQVISPSNKAFLDSTFQVMPGKIGARYRRETEYTDSVGAIVRIY